MPRQAPVSMRIARLVGAQRNYRWGDSNSILAQMASEAISECLILKKTFLGEHAPTPPGVTNHWTEVDWTGLE